MPRRWTSPVERWETQITHRTLSRCSWTDMEICAVWFFGRYDRFHRTGEMGNVISKLVFSFILSKPRHKSVLGPMQVGHHGVRVYLEEQIKLLGQPRRFSYFWVHFDSFSVWWRAWHFDEINGFAMQSYSLWVQSSQAKYFEVFLISLGELNTCVNLSRSDQWDLLLLSWLFLASFPFFLPGLLLPNIILWAKWNWNYPMKIQYTWASKFIDISIAEDRASL